MPNEEALAEAVFARFSPLRDKLRALEQRYPQLPGRPQLEEPLLKLARSLEVCRRAREVDAIVKALKAELPALVEGTQLLSILEPELSEAAVRGGADKRRTCVTSSSSSSHGMARWVRRFGRSRRRGPRRRGRGSGCGQDSRS